MGLGAVVISSILKNARLGFLIITKPYTLYIPPDINRVWLIKFYFQFYHTKIPECCFFSAAECFWIPWCQAGLMPWTVLYSVFHSVLPFKGRIGNCWHSGGRYCSLLPASTVNPLLRRVWCEIHLLQIHAESLASHWKFPPEIWRKPFPVKILLLP